MSPPYPEEDEDSFSVVPPYRRERTWTGKLRRFHSQFDSGIRAILRDCLFREVDEAGIVIFQILCPNQAVQKRLIQKRQRVGNMVHLIWLGKIDMVAFCLESKEGLQCQIFNVLGSRI